MPSLSDYQVVARDRLLARNRYGVFDEMGVGKTAPAILAAAERAGHGVPVLVTVPAYLAYNWEREFAKWLPSAQVVSALGERPQREAAFNSNADFVITPYHSWNRIEPKKGPVRSYPILQKRKWAGLLFDESHRLRGMNSNWTKRITQLQNVENKNRDNAFWFLTGTPLVRDAGDVWTFLHLMDRQLYKSYWNFVERVCHVAITPWERIIGKVRDPEEFSAIMARYSIRRLAKDIPELADLEHVENDVWLNLPPVVLKAMRKAKRDYIFEHPDIESIEYDSGGALVQSLLQLSSDPPGSENPKMKAFGDYLREEVPYTRVGVATWYRNTAYLAAKVAEGTRRPVVLFTGDMKESQKRQALQTYDSNDRTIIVGTIAAMKEGLNLQAGSNCCFLEESDLPEDNSQFIGRFKRRGQSEKVHVTRFLMDGPEAIKHRHILKREAYIREAMIADILRSEDF